MKCAECHSLKTITEFRDYSQYENTKQQLEKYVNNHTFELIEESEFEKTYQCVECHTCWILAESDFPVQGYFVQKT